MFSAIDIFDDPLVIQIGWTLVHSIWVCGLLACMLAVFLWVLRERSPQARYAAACLTMLLMGIAPIVTFGLMASRASGTPSLSLIPPYVPASTSGPDAEASGGPNTRSMNAVPTLSRTEEWIPYGVVAWITGVAILAFRQVVGWVMLRRFLRQYAVGIADLLLLERWHQLAVRMKVRKPVAYLQSAAVASPFTFGWLRPIIVVPISLLNGLPVEYVDAIIAHELSHIRRNDFLINLLQTLVETFLFYHPAVWWASAVTRQQREQCCDRLAELQCPDPGTYAEALAKLATFRPLASTVALGANGGSLLRRLRVLAGLPECSPWSHARVIALVTLATVIGVMVLKQISDSRSMLSRRGALGGMVLGAFGLPSEGETFLEPLTAALKVDGEGLTEAESALVESLNRGMDPGALVAKIASKVNPGAGHLDHQALALPFESVWKRRRLTDRLWDRAKELAGTKAVDSKAFARAAVLLASLDADLAGPGGIRRYVREGNAAALLGLAPAELAVLQKQVESHNYWTGRLTRRLIRANAAVATVLASDGRPRNDVLFKSEHGACRTGVGGGPHLHPRF